METVKRRRRGEGIVEYKVYEKEEAEKKGLKFRFWKESDEGSWALTDDNYVAECLNKKTYFDRFGRSHTYRLFPFGLVWDNAKKLEYLARKEHGNSYRGQNWLDIETRRVRTKRTVRLYAQMVYNGRVDWERLGRTYRPDQKIPEATVRRLFKQDRIQKMASIELNKIMESEGVTRDLAIRTLKKAIEIAEKKMDANALLKAADNILELHGEKQSRKVITEQIEATQNISSMIDEERRKLTALRKSEELS